MRWTRSRPPRPRASGSPSRPAPTTSSSPPRSCPPIREEANREALWQGLIDGTIDCIVSDHSPSTAELKLLDTGDFGAAWGGISSLQLGLSLVWTEAVERGIDLAEVVGWMATA